MSGGQAADQAAWKRAVAEAAVREIPDGATVGLGTGSTAEQMLLALAERVRAGLRVRGVATSERTQALAMSLGIPLAPLDEVDHLDLSIDGADEVTLPDLQVLKGRGGALLREKLVAASSRYRIILVDVTKIVPALGAGTTIPVEVEMFGWRHTAARLAAPGCRIVRRTLAEAPSDDPAARAIHQRRRPLHPRPDLRRRARHPRAGDAAQGDDRRGRARHLPRHDRARLHRRPRRRARR